MLDDRTLVGARARALEHAGLLGEAEESAVASAASLERSRRPVAERAQRRRLDSALALDRAGEFLRVIDEEVRAGDPWLAATQAVRRVFGHALAEMVASMSRAMGAPGESAESAAAEALTVAAGVGKRDEYRVSLDTVARLVGQVREMFATELAGPWQTAVADSLAKQALPLCSRRQRTSALAVAGVRLPALALAAEARARDLPELAAACRHIAAGISFLQRRAEDPSCLEVLVLAIA
jgi:hypothetical protein